MSVPDLVMSDFIMLPRGLSQIGLSLFLFGVSRLDFSTLVLDLSGVGSAVLLRAHV